MGATGRAPRVPCNRPHEDPRLRHRARPSCHHHRLGMLVWSGWAGWLGGSRTVLLASPIFSLPSPPLPRRHLQSLHLFSPWDLSSLPCPDHTPSHQTVLQRCPSSHNMVTESNILCFEGCCRVCVCVSLRAAAEHTSPPPPYSVVNVLCWQGADYSR